jgi:inorganic pyrophosphatase
MRRSVFSRQSTTTTTTTTAAGAMTMTTSGTMAMRALTRALAWRRPMVASPSGSGKMMSNAVAQPRTSVSAYRSTRSVAAKAAAYGSERVGEFPSLDFRMFVTDEASDAQISAWHGVPLKNADGSYNFICEIPKETKAKMEVATDEKLTPIKQDTKKGKLRDYPYNINWNYGMLPQTWEDPKHEHPTMKVSGDNDPVDVVEIGSRALAMGSINPVKPVGIYAMIDDGELDWKVIAISTSDPKAKDINDVADVEKHFPGELEKIRVWFRDYKTPDGKPQNKFGLDDKCMDKAYTLAVIAETHEFYNNLKSGKRANEESLSLV